MASSATAMQDAANFGTDFMCYLEEIRHTSTVFQFQSITDVLQVESELIPWSEVQELLLLMDIPGIEKSEASIEFF
jgi:hypothetical protein